MKTLDLRAHWLWYVCCYFKCLNNYVLTSKRKIVFISTNCVIERRYLKIEVKLTPGFIGRDFIQTCSFVSTRFQSLTMIYREFNGIGPTNNTVQNQPWATITRTDSSATILFKLLIHILSFSNSHNDVALIQKNRGDKLHRIIAALRRYWNHKLCTMLGCNDFYWKKAC